MGWLRQINLRLHTFLGREAAEEELDDELRFHLEMQTAQNRERGMDERTARRAALASLGGVEPVKEACREQWGGRWLETFVQDLRYGLRNLRRRPAFTLAAVLTLALGIGANTAIFSVIHGVLLAPLPYAEGEKLVVLEESAKAAGYDSLPFSVAEVKDLRAQAKAFSGVAEYHSMSFILLGRGEPVRVSTGVVSANFLDVLGMQPLYGRGFLPEDEQLGAEAVLMLGHGFWQRKFGGDPAVVGQVFEMNDRPHTVVGILPPVPQYPRENDVYMPTSACPFRARAEERGTRGAGRMLTVFGRLGGGTGLEEARAELATLAGRMLESFPETYFPTSGFTIGAQGLYHQLTYQARPTLLMLFGAVGLVLLIACTNVANLSLSHLLLRQRELAVRAVMGAGQGRLVRQLLTESLLLALAGGVLGLLLAGALLDLLRAFAARLSPRAAEIGLDGEVLLFALVVSVITGLALGALPALPGIQQLARTLLDGGTRTTTGVRQRRLRGVLVVAQVAISATLLVGAGLALRSLEKLRKIDPGFNPENVLVAPISLNFSKYTQPEHDRGYFEKLLEDLKARPEVLQAAVASSYPLNETRGPMQNDLQIEDHPVPEGQPQPRADLWVVSPEYFPTLGMPVVVGRNFAITDDAEAPQVVIVNQALARRYWSDVEPLGRRLSIDGGESWHLVVGVVGDARVAGLDRDPHDELYFPFLQLPHFAGGVVVRTEAEPAAISKLVRTLAYQIDPDQPVDEVRPLTELRAAALAPSRLTAVLLGTFAVLALAITVTGIAGVMAFSVSQRQHEIGIRMALGAARESVLALVARQGLGLVGLGLGAGLAAAWGLSRFMAGLLYGIAPTDATTFVSVAAMLTAVALLACLLPATRATRIDPVIALRND